MKIDKRITTTRESLKRSLLKIMREEPIFRIAVKDICKRANVSRGTFYLHYRSPYDLLEEIEDELFADIKAVVDKDLGPGPDMVRFFRDILKVLLKHQDTIIVNFSTHGHLRVQATISSLIHDRMVGIWRYEFPDVGFDLLEYAYAFCAGGALGIVNAWGRGGFVENPDDVARLILLLGGGIDTTFAHTKGNWNIRTLQQSEPFHEPQNSPA
ncbi:regulatory protein TetR [Parasphaerochaeta coccoides DSM 17374]|uniref:Regulatory protein TetR n=2 Tax=Parasphaerochaeta TaxID=3062336 RepID=F4GJS1_PARC1|nr:regulatory protein TetR [Parasphaerochaeta coccoides DSM 17374]